MSAMKDLSAEIADCIAAAQDVDPSDVIGAILDGRVSIGAVGPSDRVWVSAQGDEDSAAVLSLVVSGGFGLVASLDGGEWVTVRELQISEEEES